MNRLIISIVLSLLFGTVHAELQPPVRTLPPITDASMVIIAQGAKIEIFPTKRATAASDHSGRMVAQQVMTTNANSTIGPHRLGVVFNHALQQQGYITGEIAFKMKAGHSESRADSALYPGLKKITAPEVYVVNARTPAEFIRVMKLLQARQDLEWVEPTVTYSLTLETTPNTR